jgi:hypothetical protein
LRFRGWLEGDILHVVPSSAASSTPAYAARP